MVKHAEAQHLWIRLTNEQSAVCLEVVDDGRGLLPKDKRRPGLGLDSMAYRARILNGDLSVVTLQSGGTSVRCRIPSGKMKISVLQDAST